MHIVVGILLNSGLNNGDFFKCKIHGIEIKYIGKQFTIFRANFPSQAGMTLFYPQLLISHVGWP